MNRDYPDCVYEARNTTPHLFASDEETVVDKVFGDDTGVDEFDWVTLHGPDGTPIVPVPIPRGEGSLG